MNEIILLIEVSLKGCTNVAKYIEMEKGFMTEYPLEYRVAMMQLKESL